MMQRVARVLSPVGEYGIGFGTREFGKIISRIAKPELG
jgi:hypothetical protein